MGLKALTISRLMSALYHLNEMKVYVADVKKGISKSITFFSNDNKANRELWVLKEFLKHLPIAFDENAIRPSYEEPNDVFLRNVGFQVKEVLSPTRQRHKEYKDKFNQITKKTLPSDLLEEYNPRHVHLSEDLPTVMAELIRQRQKYGDLSKQINVLVYLNLEDTTYVQSDVNVDEFMGEVDLWNSVIVVTNSGALILKWENSINEFENLVGKILFKSN